MPVRPRHVSIVVSQRKLTDYLLSDSHPVGRFKAVFFQSMGYSNAAPNLLAQDLTALVGNSLEISEVTPFGRKFLSRGTLEGPSGRKALVTAIWIILPGEDQLRLVTAYPEA
jgi:hypothetical protein